MSVDPTFWRNRRVLLTGHTGFKGAWCALWLARMDAQVTGLALAPETIPNLFDGAGIGSDVRSYLVDLREREAVRDVVERLDPEIVLHFAAQALVRQSVRHPVETVATNVLGAVHLLDALRKAPSLRSIVVATSDKVYENNGSGRPFREDDALGGTDPYAASKAAAELVTRAMAYTYLTPNGVAIGTVRAGNVIGGGDYAADRLVPDIVRAVSGGAPVLLRYPDAVRPWQHVLDCLSGYLVYAQALFEGRSLPPALNVGPAPPFHALTVRDLAEAVLGGLGSQAGWQRDDRPGPKEAEFLALDSSLIRDRLGWRDRLPMPLALETTVAWYRDVNLGYSMRAATLAQIDAFSRNDGGGDALLAPCSATEA
jgi:CDP-glucose 4,6-dehydratase